MGLLMGETDRCIDWKQTMAAEDYAPLASDRHKPRYRLKEKTKKEKELEEIRKFV